MPIQHTFSFNLYLKSLNFPSPEEFVATCYRKLGVRSCRQVGSQATPKLPFVATTL